MMGMGFLRLNKILAKHRWRRRVDDDAEEKSGEQRKSSIALWLAVMAILVISVVIFGAVHSSKFV